MPIKPEHRKLYPANWPEISYTVKFRAGWRCEWCGAPQGRPHPITGKIVRLAAAHLDHNRQNCDWRNLRCLCQRCHLRYDAVEHRRNAAKTRREAMATLELPI